MNQNDQTPSPLSLQIRGVVPIIPTPFREDQEIDWGSLHALIDFSCAARACAVCLPAYASEFYKLSEEERRRAVAEAVDHMSGRLPVIAQVNAFSSKQAKETALAAQQTGASAVGVTVPRLIALGERDLFRHFDRVLTAIDIPLIIQDFNPGGPTLSADFIANLHKVHPHFRYVKLEEPMMASKVAAIAQRTSGEVGVLEGWGGMYMLELIPAGICGTVPSLGIADLLVQVFRLAEQTRHDEAYAIFQGVLPQIAFSLQNLELLHHVEKSLLVARGILAKPLVREANLELGPFDKQHMDFLNIKILELLDRLHLPRNPTASRLPEA
jgi:4-hydroxy-tetrahydrodipicolinate synthase